VGMQVAINRRWGSIVFKEEDETNLVCALNQYLKRAKEIDELASRIHMPG